VKQAALKEMESARAILDKLPADQKVVDESDSKRAGAATAEGVAGGKVDKPTSKLPLPAGWTAFFNDGERKDLERGWWWVTAGFAARIWTRSAHVLQVLPRGNSDHHAAAAKGEAAEGKGLGCIDAGCCRQGRPRYEIEQQRRGGQRRRAKSSEGECKAARAGCACCIPFQALMQSSYRCIS
jgi:hypothetical protein